MRNQTQIKIPKTKKSQDNQISQTQIKINLADQRARQLYHRMISPSIEDIGKFYIQQVQKAHKRTFGLRQAFLSTLTQKQIQQLKQCITQYSQQNKQKVNQRKVANCLKKIDSFQAEHFGKYFIPYTIRNSKTKNYQKKSNFWSGINKLVLSLFYQPQPAQSRPMVLTGPQIKSQSVSCAHNSVPQQLLVTQLKQPKNLQLNSVQKQSSESCHSARHGLQFSAFSPQQQYQGSSIEYWPKNVSKKAYRNCSEEQDEECPLMPQMTNLQRIAPKTPQKVNSRKVLEFKQHQNHIRLQKIDQTLTDHSKITLAPLARKKNNQSVDKIKNN